MAGDLNRATLIGRLGGDPEVKTLDSGGRVVSFSLATSEGWKDKATGERKERTQWHRVVIWNENVGKIVEKWLVKGAKCLVEGSIESREYKDRDGAKRNITEIVLRGFDSKVILLSDKSSGKGGHETEQRSGAEYNGLDDEIPF